MGLSHDIRVIRDGTVAPYEPLAFPVGASQTVYAGGAICSALMPSAVMKECV